MVCVSYRMVLYRFSSYSSLLLQSKYVTVLRTFFQYYSVRAGRNMQLSLNDKCVFVIYRCLPFGLHCLINIGVKVIGWEEA